MAISPRGSAALLSGLVLVMVACGDIRQEPEPTAPSDITSVASETETAVPATLVPVTTRDLGPFRLVTGREAIKRYRAAPANFKPEQDAATIRASDLFVEPTQLGSPADVTSLSASASEGEILAIDEFLQVDLEGSTTSIQITRWKGLDVPVELNEPLAGGAITVEPGDVNGNPAVFFKGSADLGVNDILFLSGDVVTFLRGSTAFDLLLGFAESVSASSGNATPTPQ